MLSSGKSEAKREQQRAYQKAYLEALGQTSRIDNATKQNTNNHRTLRRELEDNGLEMGGSNKYLSRKLDGMSRNFNESLPNVNKSIDAYNERYDKFERQKNGETILDGYNVNVANPNQQGGLLTAVMGNQPKQFNTQEEAQAFADAELARLNAPQKNPLGLPVANSQPTSMGLLGVAGAEASKPKAQVTERNMGAITDSYRTLNQTRDAYNDLNALGKGVNDQVDASGMGNFRSEYDVIAERIRGNLKRNQPITEQQTQPKKLLSAKVSAKVSAKPTDIYGLTG